MKARLILSLLTLTMTGYAANAAQYTPSDYSDIDVVSVTPRSQNVKPYVMAIFTREQQERVAALKKSQARDPIQGR